VADVVYKATRDRARKRTQGALAGGLAGTYPQPPSICCRMRFPRALTRLMAKRHNKAALTAISNNRTKRVM